MDLDPHTLQQILQRIYQQMRCPQCGKKVPIDISSVRVVADSNMLLQLKCDQCNAYVVLQASLQGVDSLGAPPYSEDSTSNASSALDVGGEDVKQVKAALVAAEGSFEKLFADSDHEAMPDTEIV